MNLMAGSPAASDVPTGPARAMARFGALEATELQDQLLTTFNDLERLQRLLDGMCDSLLGHFSRVNDQLGLFPLIGLDWRF